MRVISLCIPTRYQETSYGYDCGLFTNPSHENYICQICQMVIREAHRITACGHHFCRSCLDQWLEDNEVCPICRKKDTTHAPNRQKDREINGLEIHCPNPENNQDRANHMERCGWSGELGDLQSHLDGCDYKKVSCTNKGCRVIMKRKLLAKHLQKNCCQRLVQCEHCHLDVPYWMITGEISKSSHIPPIHCSECPEYPLACPNRCGVTGIRRRAMPDHHSSCPLEPLDCPFKDAGCTEKVARKDMEDHKTANQQKHMLLTFQSLQHTKKELHDTKQELDNTKREICDTSQELEDTKREVQNTKRDLQDTKYELQDTKQELQDTKQELQDTKRELQDTKRDLQDTKQELQNTKRELDDTKRELHCAKEKPHENVSYEVQRMESLCAIGDTVTFQMSDFCRLRKEKKVWHSPQFSIQDKVRVRLAVDPSGVGRGQGSHVSVSLKLMEVVKKEKDTILECDVSVTAIGQHRSATPKILELCTVRMPNIGKSVLRPQCSAYFSFPSPGEGLQSKELFLQIEEATSLLANDAVALELKLLEHQQHRVYFSTVYDTT